MTQTIFIQDGQYAFDADHVRFGRASHTSRGAFVDILYRNQPMFVESPVLTSPFEIMEFEGGSKRLKLSLTPGANGVESFTHLLEALQEKSAMHVYGKRLLHEDLSLSTVQGLQTPTIDYPEQYPPLISMKLDKKCGVYDTAGALLESAQGSSVFRRARLSAIFRVLLWVTGNSWGVSMTAMQVMVVKEGGDRDDGPVREAGTDDDYDEDDFFA